jgi:hypothetical protein
MAYSPWRALQGGIQRLFVSILSRVSWGISVAWRQKIYKNQCFVDAFIKKTLCGVMQSRVP